MGENLAWFCVLWIIILVARQRWRATHPPLAVIVPSSSQHKTPRPLKPRTPHDCPVCGRPHPTPLISNVRQSGVLAWHERKNPRGRRKTVCTAGYACPHPDGDYQGNTDPSFHALVGDGKRGADGIPWLKCQACSHRFSSRRGTALYRLRTPAAQVAQVLLADTALLFHHSEVTIRLWLTRAGQHAEKVHAHFFQNLTLGHLQLDELFTTLRDKAHDLPTGGCAWVWVAFDPATKLMPALQLGPRTQHMAHALLHAVTSDLAPGQVPVFTSDGLDLYFYAITAHFGQWVTNVTTGKTRWQVALGLLYGQVKKSYRRRRLARVERRMRWGDFAQLTDRPKSLGFSGTLNTAFVEHINLTLRHALAALSRRSWATAQLTGKLLAHLEWWRAYPQGAFGLTISVVHICPCDLSWACLKPATAHNPHVAISRAPQLHLHCTAGASVAAGLTDHVWSVQELLAFPVSQ